MNTLDPFDSDVAQMLSILSEEVDDTEPTMDRRFTNPLILRSGMANGLSTVSHLGSATVNYCVPWETLTEQMRLNRIINYVNMHTVKLDLDLESVSKLKKVVIKAFNNLDVQYDQAMGIIDCIRNLTISFVGTSINISIKRAVSKVTKVTKMTGFRRKHRRRHTSVLDASKTEEIETPSVLEMKIEIPVSPMKIHASPIELPTLPEEPEEPEEVSIMPVYSPISLSR